MSGEALKTQDEILQVLFWMRGENLGEHASAEELNRFLRMDSAVFDAALSRLIENGLLVLADGRYRPSERGIEEGRRRFSEEFSKYLGKENHLTCTDPSCDCHSEGLAANCVSHPAHA